jgi:tricorn protease
LADYDVKFPAIGPGPNGGGEIVFQYGPELRLLDLPTGKMRVVEIRIPGDRQPLRPRAIDTARFISAWSLSPNGKRAAVSARGDIWTLPAKDGTPRNLTRTSGVAERDPAWSPDGRWIAYFSDATGEYELYLAQSDGKGETKQLTKDGKCFRYSPQWSPDSKRLVFADKTGAFYLHTIATGETKRIDADPNPNTAGPSPISWSPDNRWIAYAKNAPPPGNAAIWIYSVETGEKRQVTSGMFADSTPVFDRKGDYLYFASSRAFSPTYSDLDTTWVYIGTQILLAVPLRADTVSPYAPKSDEETWTDDSKEKQPQKASAEGGVPVFGASGLQEGFATIPQTPNTGVTQGADELSGEWTGTVTGEGLPNGSVAMRLTLKLGAGNVLTGTLLAGPVNTPVMGTYNPATKELTLAFESPFGPATMTAKIANGKLSGTIKAQNRTVDVQAERPGGAPAPAAPQTPRTPEKPALRVTIDFEGFEARAIPLPIRSGRFGTLAVNAQNQLIFARLSLPGSDAPSSIKLFDIADPKKEEKVVAAGVSAFDISSDGKKLLALRGNNSASIQDAVAGATGENVVTSGMTATIAPRDEWKQLFTEAWRIQRDFFYDPYMHGVNWPAIRDQYARMLDDCNSRADVSYVIGEMIAELNVGHAYYFGGDTPPEPNTSVGLLGVDFELKDGAYRFAKIYQGATWDVDARSPLAQPGLKVKEGDYLLAVNGVPIDTSKDPYAAFQGLADRVVTLTVSDRPKLDSSAREITTRLLASEQTLRYRAWIEKNRAYVEKMTNGRVGYVYVPDTGINGQNDLVRQFSGQMNKEALIIDERWNGGGQIPTRFIELLNRPITNYFARRDGADWPWPLDGHQGPKCMLINGPAGSGGDAFPWYFRQSKLGKLIGTRTWGGLVGISGNPELIDGGYTSAPTFAFYKKDGHWGVEGHGVDPDIEVIDDPAQMQDGADPQLDTAIKLMLEELKRNPYVPAKRPPYPNRVKIGIEDKDR